MVTTDKTSPSAAPAKAAAAAPAKPAAPAKTAAPAKKVALKPAPKKVGKKAAPGTKAPVRRVAKVAVKAAPAKKAAAKPVVVKTVATAVVKPAKEKKPKLVRDSFTIPKAEYSVLDELKQRAGKLGSPIKKSELLRAGIKALAAMADSALVAALKAVPAVKTGRPAKD